ncbi:MAG TPA: hypothetical protein VFP34_05265, partial [Microlunatus sp.]|nr:hypothetical protein [Microlunatus sp.]
MSDANRGSGYAGPTQADRSGRSDEVADRAASPTSASSPSGHRGEAREGYATSPQASPFGPPNGAPASPDQYGSPWAAYSGGSNGSSSPSGPSQPGPASHPTSGNGYYSPNSDFAPSSEAAPTAAANAPGDALPADGQSGAGAPSWEPVAYRPKKPLRERWTDLTAKLSGRHESAGAAESDSDAAARVWASSAAAGGVMATGAAGDSPGQTQTEQTQ